MKIIQLSKQGKNKGKFSAIVDDDDFEEINKFRWSYTRGYAIRRAGRLCLLMHRQIMETPEGLETDHINGHKLDNRRTNLRVVNHTENNRYRPIQKNNTSGYKGVAWNRTLKYWVAYIKVDQKRLHLGYFNNKEEAAIAYNKSAKKYHGKFAILNKIPC